MKLLTLEGWRVGLKKVSLTQLIQAEVGAGLQASKSATDRLMAGERVVLGFDSAARRERFRSAAEGIGVVFAPTTRMPSAGPRPARSGDSIRGQRAREELTPGCDVSLGALQWIRDGHDLCLRLRCLVRGESRREEKVFWFSWVSALRVDVHFPDSNGAKFAGMPMTWESRIEEAPGGRSWVLFDFASTGELSFEFQDVELVVCAAENRATDLPELEA